MLARRLAAFAMLGLGIWLSYGGIHPLVIIMERGSDLANALFDPPTTIIRLAAAAAMVIGGLMAILKVRGGGMVSLFGAILFTALGGLMALSGADQGLWMDELLYGVGAIGIAVLILTLRRI